MKKIFCFLILVAFFLLISQKNVYAQYKSEASAVTKVGNPTSPMPGGGSGGDKPVPDVEKDQLAALIKSEFGLDLVGNFTLGMAQNIYKTMSHAYNSSLFYYNLDSINKPVRVNLNNDGGSCFGYARGASEIDLYQLQNCSLESVEYVLIHELGHVIAMRRPDIYQQYLREGVPNPLLETYTAFANTPNESFAEMITDFVVYKVYRFTSLGRTFPEFPQKYPKYYQFAHDIIFGVDF